MSGHRKVTGLIHDPPKTITEFFYATGEIIMALVPTPKPELIPGKPNIYGIYYPKVNGWYIGKNETGLGDYMGSPSHAALKAIHDAHTAVKVGPDGIMREKHILWSPPDATIADCRNQEWIWIDRFRREHDGPVFNLFPGRNCAPLRWVKEGNGGKEGVAGVDPQHVVIGDTTFRIANSAAGWKFTTKTGDAAPVLVLTGTPGGSNSKAYYACVKAAQDARTALGA
jgi:hypothetical protein